MKTVKKELLNQCQNYTLKRLQRVQNIISGIQESLTSETKSSAGDKHETGRAMLQLEREKAGKQLAEVQKLQEILAKVSIVPSDHIRLGSLVFTSQANYFISISIGQLVINNKQYFAIAVNSPIGKMLLGETVGSTFNFNGKQISINAIH